MVASESDIFALMKPIKSGKARMMRSIFACNHLRRIKIRGSSKKSRRPNTLARMVAGMIR